MENKKLFCQEKYNCNKNDGRMSYMNKKFKLFSMFLLIIVLGISTFTVFGAVSNFIKSSAITVTTNNIKKDTEAITINLKIPVVKGVSKLNVEKKINNRLYNDAINFANPLEKDAKKYLAETKKNKDLHFNKYSAFTTFKSPYNKGTLLSIPVRYAQYTGGANGLEVQTGYNFDLRNGKLLLLSDLFEKNFNYKKVISDEVLRQIKANKENFFPETITSFKEIKGNHPYYIENGNLVIFYGPFDIAPHSSGIPEFKIPFSKLKFDKSLGLQ